MTELARQAISHPTYFQTTCRNAITAWQYTDKTAEIQVANVLSFKDYFEYVLQKGTETKVIRILEEKGDKIIFRVVSVDGAEGNYGKKELTVKKLEVLIRSGIIRIIGTKTINEG